MLAAFCGREEEVAELDQTTTRDAVARGDGPRVALRHWATAILCNGLGRYGAALAAAQLGAAYPADMHMSSASGCGASIAASMRVSVRVAHDLLTSIGMEAFAERARRELLATGETVRKRTVETLDELTPQELQVARLAAGGRTNAEIGAQLFVSPRTVEWHLSKVFGKLGVSSRKELRAALSDVGAVTTAV